MKSNGFDFSTREATYTSVIPVQVTHLNYGNHLGYDSVLSIMQEARMRWLKSSNLTELSIDKDVGYLVTHVSVEYKSEAHFGDELEIMIYPENLSRKGFDLYYMIKNRASEKVVAIANTSHVFYNFSTNKISRTPDVFKSHMCQHVSE